jgi:amidase
MAGDFYTAPPPARAYASEVGAPAGRLRVGVRTRCPLDLAAVDPECVAATEDAARLLESLGHSVEEASPEGLDDPALYAAFFSVVEASVRADLADLAEKLGRPVTSDDVEASTWQLYEAGARIGGGDYVRALTQLHQVVRRAVAWWVHDGFDLLLTPTLAEPPPVIGDLPGDPSGGRAIPFAIFTAPFNISGQPAMSVPLYVAASGLPIGVQLVGAPYREDVLFRVAAQLEEARPWSGNRPPVHA